MSKMSFYRVKKGIAYLKHYGWKEFWVRVKERLKRRDVDYDAWYQKHKVSEEALKKQRKTKFAYNPMISIVTPVYNTPVLYLRQMIESVQKQSYENWELCIANASPSNAEVKSILEDYAIKDNRIRVVEVEENLGISQNTNVALEIASGEYVGFLDHDDLLAADALYEIVKKLNENSKLEMIYTDEDKVTEDLEKHFQPHFKPEFNLDLMRANNYICHFCVIRRSLILEVGGFRKEFDGAQDYDLFLRCIEKAKGIARIPRILYHWRVHRESTADNPASKMYAYEAGKRAIEAHLERLGQMATVSCEKDLGFYRVKYQCKEDLEDECLLFLNSDVKAMNPDWMEEMRSNCQRKEVGVVGAKLYYPNNTVYHAGMILGLGGVAGYAFSRMPKEFSGYMHKASLQQNLSAVTGACMMVKRSAFEEVGGFTEGLSGVLRDVDLCLKMQEKGYLVVFNPYAEMIHYGVEEKSVVDTERVESECQYMKQRWGQLLQNDPMYNPNLTLEKYDYSVGEQKE